MLPKVDGLTLCQRLRREESTSGIPILMLTALGATKDKVSGFNSGADDYITKPFDLEELHVRIKALLRRTNRAQLNSSNQQEILNYGPLTLVPERFEAICCACVCAWFDVAAWPSAGNTGSPGEVDIPAAGLRSAQAG